MTAAELTGHPPSSCQLLLTLMLTGASHSTPVGTRSKDSANVGPSTEGAAAGVAVGAAHRHGRQDEQLPVPVPSLNMSLPSFVM